MVGLRVTDDAGATAAITHSVTIADAPPQPSLSAPSAVLVGQQVTLDGSASRDPDGSIADYRWDLSGSGSYATDTGTTPTTTTTFSSPGTVTVGLRVTDNASLSAATTRAIQVVRPPVAHITATPSPVSAGQKVTLDASGSATPDGAITDYRWDLDGSGQYATDSGT